MKKNILFLCTGNSCRSQMAEGMLKAKAADRFNAFSAGVNPTDINPLTIKVMKEVGIDISAQYSKSVDKFLGKDFDYVITLCDNARATCPAFSGRHEKIHWNLPDPSQADGREEEKLLLFRKVRDKIEENVRLFINSKA